MKTPVRTFAATEASETPLTDSLAERTTTAALTVSSTSAASGLWGVRKQVGIF